MAQLFWPFDTATVSEWPGTRPEGWADHVGTDFAVPQGTPLKATMSGTVDIIWNDGLGAWVIDIIAPDGTVARHGHLSHMAVKDGQWVNAGDYIGNTGGAIGTPGAGLSTGSHLHWEIRNNRGWGATGWYDPRHLAIKSFGTSSGTAQPLATAETNTGLAQMRRRKKGPTMHLVYLTKGARSDGSAAYAIYTPGVKGSWEEFDNSTGKGKYANALAAQYGTPMEISLKRWLELQKKYGA